MQSQEPRRILFGDHPSWRRKIAARLDPDRYAASFGFGPDTDPAPFDLVVPLQLPQFRRLRAWVAAGTAVALLPPADTAALCNDKLAFNRHLITHGFAHCIPPLIENEPRYPHIRKPRRGRFGRDCTIVRTADEDPGPDRDFFRQELVAGDEEYVWHVLRAGGEIAFQRLYRYEMAGAEEVRGIDATPNDCLRDDAATVPGELVAILELIDFQGTCCFNYKLTNGKPQLFEVNPRFGGSLVRDINEYLAASLEVCARRLPGD